MIADADPELDDTWDGGPFPPHEKAPDVESGAEVKGSVVDD